MALNYQIIYLNGSTSVGKTTLARTLQDKLSEPFLLIGYDQIIDMMPKKFSDSMYEPGDPALGWKPKKNMQGFGWETIKAKDGSPLYKPISGPFGDKVKKALHDIVLLLACSKLYIIIDDVSLGKKHVDKWRRLLKGFKVLWVGLTAPIEIIEMRERARKDRKIGSARWQAEHVHAGVKYDLMLDTYAQTVEENAERIIKLVET